MRGAEILQLVADLRPGAEPSFVLVADICMVIFSLLLPTVLSVGPSLLVCYLIS